MYSLHPKMILEFPLLFWSQNDILIVCSNVVVRGLATVPRAIAMRMNESSKVGFKSMQRSKFKKIILGWRE